MLQDVVTRYASATGHHVVRRFGWDCHGLPVEYEIDQKLGAPTLFHELRLPSDGTHTHSPSCSSVPYGHAECVHAVLSPDGFFSAASRAQRGGMLEWTDRVTQTPNI